MMIGSIPHIVGHHIDEVEVLNAALEVDILRTAHTRQSQPALLSQGLSEVAHQQGEVLSVVRRRTDAGTVLSGIFPIDVDAVQPVLFANATAVLSKCFSIAFVCCHLAETAAAPTANAQHDEQFGLLLLETHEVAKPLFIIDANPVELVIHMPKGIVKVRHHCRIGHHLRPGCHISHYDWLSLFACKSA